MTQDPTYDKLRPILSKFDAIALEDYFPHEKERILGEAVGELRKSNDLENEKYAQAEWMLLNRAFSYGNGDTWKQIIEAEKIKQKHSFWNYNEDITNYFLWRLGTNLPALTAARINFYLWTATDELKFVDAAILNFLKAMNEHAQTELEYFRNAEFCGRMALKLLLLLKRKEDVKKLLVPSLKELISKNTSNELDYHLRNLVNLAFETYAQIYDLLDTVEKDYLVLIIDLCKEKSIEHSKTNNFHIAIIWVEIVEKFAKSIKLTDLINETQTLHLKLLIAEADMNPAPLLKVSFYRSALDYLKSCGTNEPETERNLKLALEKAVRDSEGSYKTVSTPVTIPNEVIAKAAEEICDSKTNYERLIGLAEFLIPNTENIAKEIKSRPQTLLSLLPKVIQKDGHISKPYSDKEDRERYDLLSQILLTVQINEMIIRYAIDKYQITIDDIYSVFDSSTLADDKKQMLKQGVERYYSNDFVSSCSILCPQIEELIRQVLSQNGKETIITDPKTKAVNQSLLASLVRNPNVESLLGLDFCRVIEAYYANPDFFNLRNKVCHGMAKISDLNKKNSTITLFTILFILSKLNPKVS